MLIFRRTHMVNYKSKTNTETVWEYKTMSVLTSSCSHGTDSLAVTEALHTLCDKPWCAGDGRTIIYEISQLYRVCGARSGSRQLHA